MGNNSKNRPNSIHRYLNQRYLAILISLCIIFVVVVLFMRYSAMDDTTDYYMHYDAQVLSEFYQVTDNINEFDNGIKEYYWGIEHLPKKYQVLLDIELSKDELVLDQTQMFSLNDQIFYILPFYSQEKSEIFFVIHIFNNLNESLFYQTWQNAFIALFTLFLILVIFYILQTNRNITHQMAVFSSWIKSMSHFDYLQLTQQKTPKALNFEELVNSAQYLQTSLLAQHELQDKEQKLLTREKHFLSSLSHELRTPIAIISAALALLEKSDDINPDDKVKLVKLAKAHRKMKQLTQTLLQLWRGQQNSAQSLQTHLVQNKVFLLAELIEQAVITCKERFNRRNINFSVTMFEEVSLFSQYELAEILIDNLLSNACQYSGDGNVAVQLNQNTLQVQNTVEDKVSSVKINQNVELSTIGYGYDYGYGLGLFLVDKICKQQHWQLIITSTEQLFSVKVIFNTQK